MSECGGPTNASQACLHRVLWVSIFTSPTYPHTTQWPQSPSWLIARACPHPTLHSLFMLTCVHMEPPTWFTQHPSVPSLLGQFFPFLMLLFIQVDSIDSARCFLKLGVPSLLGGLPLPLFSSLHPMPELLLETWTLLPPVTS